MKHPEDHRMAYYSGIRDGYVKFAAKYLKINIDKYADRCADMMLYWGGEDDPCMSKKKYVNRGYAYEDGFKEGFYQAKNTDYWYGDWDKADYIDKSKYRDADACSRDIESGNVWRK